MKYLITTLAGTVLLAFFSFLLPSSITISAHESQNGFTIHMNEDGFSPKRLIIKPGSRVIFENTGSAAIWPASNDHPSHTLYDGTSAEEHCATPDSDAFDACGGVSPGKSWSFIFEKTGIYGFHDHFDSYMGGKIIVRTFPLENFFRNIFHKSTLTSKESAEINSQKIEKYEYVKTRYSRLVRKDGAGVAIDKLTTESAADPEIGAICHDLLHTIGRTAYEKYGGFEKSIIYHKDFCNSGYIHGLFEVYFLEESDPLANIGTLCRDRSVLPRGFDVWQCEHGIGHGIMYFTQGDLDESIRLCQDSLSESAAVNCINGAYMEVFNTEVLAKEPEFVDKENPLKTCELRDIGKADCFIYAPVYFYGTLGMDFNQIIERCTEPGGIWRDSCMLGVGSEMMKRNMHDEQSVFETCSFAKKEKDELSCIAGAAAMNMNQKGSFEAGAEFCISAPEKFREACYKLIEGKRGMFE